MASLILLHHVCFRHLTIRTLCPVPLLICSFAWFCFITGLIYTSLVYRIAADLNASEAAAYCVLRLSGGMAAASIAGKVADRSGESLSGVFIIYLL